MKFPFLTTLVFGCILAICYSQPLPPKETFKLGPPKPIKELPKKGFWTVHYMIPTNYVLEVWHKTNLLDSFTFYTNKQMLVGFELPEDKPSEFFICRVVDTITGQPSDWNIK